jgi:hypothetical protein
MAEQWNNGQPNQQPPQPPYPYQPHAPQGYQGPPPQPYQNPYPQQAQQQPQQYGAPPQQYGAPQQPYPQVSPQQHPGQPYPGQQQYGQPYPGQQPYGQPYPGQQPYGQPPQAPGQPQSMDQNQPAPKKPKKKRGKWAIFFIVLFSPFIAVAFVLYGLYWVLAWLLTPVGLLLHFVFCALGLIWYSGVKLLASGRSKYRLFQPLYPRFPAFWTGQYWVRMNRTVRSIAEGLAGVLELLNW